MKNLFFWESIFFFHTHTPFLEQPHSTFILLDFFANLSFSHCCTAVSKCAHCTEISPLLVSMKNVAHSSSKGKDLGLLHKQAFEEIDL